MSVYPRPSGRFVLIFILLFAQSPVHTLFISHLACRSTPTKPKKAGVSESLVPPPRPMVGHIIRMSAFSAKPENETARFRSPQIFHQPGGHYGHCKPSCFCYKSVMHLHDCSPSVSTASNPPLQLIRRQCLLLLTRSSPGLPRTPARANSLARGASCTDSR